MWDGDIRYKIYIQRFYNVYTYITLYYQYLFRVCDEDISYKIYIQRLYNVYTYITLCYVFVSVKYRYLRNVKNDGYNETKTVM